ncbi:hypothetical protein [Altererythrobacter sp. GH1-8]|uniref:hypothetical protein n=1 Tax=Altererythrobacter sp. GH1-8 TaxID=3349333 RepID=UPI00374DA713
MTKRPILSTLLYWGVIGLIQLYLAVSCGFGAGWDEESHQAIVECHYQASVQMQALNFISIVVYSIGAIWAVKSLKRKQRGVMDEGAE